MTHLPTTPARCRVCDRILFATRAGRWPYHIQPGARGWCVASDTVAPEVRGRAVTRN
jgi:hypothetical protein